MYSREFYRGNVPGLSSAGYRPRLCLPYIRDYRELCVASIVIARTSVVLSTLEQSRFPLGECECGFGSLACSSLAATSGGNAPPRTHHYEAALKADQGRIQLDINDCPPRYFRVLLSFSGRLKPQGSSISSTVPRNFPKAKLVTVGPRLTEH